MTKVVVEERFPLRTLDGRFRRDFAVTYVRRVDTAELPYILGRVILPADWDPQGHCHHDGEWEAQLPHERIEFEGQEVPAYDLEQIDPERAEWQRRRMRRGRG